jgi:hypothetical protein
VTHYARKLAAPGVSPDIRVTYSVDHAIYFAFGMALEPNHVLRFTILANKDKYVTVIASLLYVVHVTSSVYHSDAHPVPSASSTSFTLLPRASLLSAASMAQR